MGYSCLLAAAWLVQRLPLRVRRFFGNLLGAACWPLIPRRRRQMAIANVQAALGVERQEAVRIARASAVRFGRMFLEVLHMPALTRESIKTYAPIHGLEHMQQVLQEGKGAILVTAHSGNWEVLGASMALHDIPTVGVAQKQTSAVMDRFINHVRRSSGLEISYKSGVRDMIQLLGKGNVIGLLSDQDAGDDGIYVDFFGRKASTPKGAAFLARLKGCAIIPAFITEQPDGTHRCEFLPPLRVAETKDKEGDIRSATEQYTQLIEKHIRQHPEEWFWLHNRWKRTAAK